MSRRAHPLGQLAERLACCGPTQGKGKRRACPPSRLRLTWADPREPPPAWSLPTAEEPKSGSCRRFGAFTGDSVPSQQTGGVAERSNALVLKTRVRQPRTAGSNPAPSARALPSRRGRAASRRGRAAASPEATAGGRAPDGADGSRGEASCTPVGLSDSRLPAWASCRRTGLWRPRSPRQPCRFERPRRDGLRCPAGIFIRQVDPRQRPMLVCSQTETNYLRFAGRACDEPHISSSSFSQPPPVGFHRG